MEHFQSTIENKWVKVNSIVLTEEQKTLLISKKAEDLIAKTELQETIKGQKYTNLTTTKAKVFNDLYNSIKPTIKEGDLYEFISMNVSKNEDKQSGILNCRLNKEHLQIRF
jgi:hypothetical protein